MNKYPILPLLLIALSACHHDFFPSTNHEQSLVCMNARLNTADSTHKVHLAYSEVNRTIPMTGAIVNLSVGDSPSDTAHVRSDGFAYFKKIIRPADIVKLSSGAASVTVSGEQEPRAIVLDATCYPTETKTEVKARIDRNPDSDNCYIVQIVSYQHAVRDNDNKVLQDTKTVHDLNLVSYPLQKYPRMFLVVNDSFGDIDHLDITVEGNTYLRAAHNMSSVYWHIKDGKEYKEHETYTRTDLVCLRISALSRDDYWTLRYLAENPNYSLGGNLVEIVQLLPWETIPKSFPNNIDGGIGLVTVRSAVEIPIAKWELHYDINNYSNPDATPLPID